MQYFSYSSNSRQINTYIIKQISRIHKHATYTEEIFGSRANERKAKELHIDVYLYESLRLINFWRNFSENATHTKLKRTRIHLIHGSHLLYWIIVYLHYQHLTSAILQFLTCVLCVRVYFLFICFSFCLYCSLYGAATFAHLSAMKLRKTAIEVTAQIEYTLIQSFKGFELCSLLGIHVFLRRWAGILLILTFICLSCWEKKIKIKAKQKP